MREPVDMTNAKMVSGDGTTAYNRPVLILSVNEDNRDCRTVTVVPLSTSLSHVDGGDVLFMTNGKTIKAMSWQITAKDKKFLTEYMYSVDAEVMDSVEAKVAAHLGFGRNYDSELVQKINALHEKVDYLLSEDKSTGEKYHSKSIVDNPNVSVSVDTSTPEPYKEAHEEDRITKSEALEKITRRRMTKEEGKAFVDDYTSMSMADMKAKYGSSEGAIRQKYRYWSEKLDLKPQHSAPPPLQRERPALVGARIPLPLS
jgi:mRNA-degrading endonuclease toxin of MazEF toxin-antitoxin module